MNNNETCQMKGCCGKFFLSAFLVFLFLFGAGYLEHHVLLKSLYEQTAAMWRPADQMRELMPLMFIRFAAIALIVTALYAKIKKAKMQACATTGEDSSCAIGSKNCPIKRGICFGAIVGTLMGVAEFKMYFMVAVPQELAIWWFVASVVKGIGMGIILSFTFCPKKAA